MSPNLQIGSNCTHPGCGAALANFNSPFVVGGAQAHNHCELVSFLESEVCTCWSCSWKHSDIMFCGCVAELTPW
jgi:hypothetical protein